MYVYCRCYLFSLSFIVGYFFLSVAINSSLFFIFCLKLRKEKKTNNHYVNGVFRADVPQPKESSKSSDDLAKREREQLVTWCSNDRR